MELINRDAKQQNTGGNLHCAADSVIDGIKKMRA